MQRRRWWGLLALVGGAAALVRWRLTPRRRAWLTHRRGEGPTAAAGQEIEPRPGDILLFHHIARLRDLLITMVTHSPFYHTALYAGDGHVVEARPQGVIFNDLQGREQNFVVVPAPEDKGEEALAWAKTRLGAKFDRLDFGIIFLEHVFKFWHINYTPKDRYTCAELVASAYEHAGVRLVPEKAIDEVEPADLARLIPASTRAGIGAAASARSHGADARD
ncbi:MAG TPA: hypothetical protein VLG68_08050 [Gammaproteobacteria bacterium]|nr:hypothetical protein [Gammaproteobacteria bacterium]